MWRSDWNRKSHSIDAISLNDKSYVTAYPLDLTLMIMNWSRAKTTRFHTKSGESYTYLYAIENKIKSMNSELRLLLIHKIKYLYSLCSNIFFWGKPYNFLIPKQCFDMLISWCSRRPCGKFSVLTFVKFQSIFCRCIPALPNLSLWQM